MIAVLGPPDLAEAVAAAVHGELVVGAADDEGLGGPIFEAASSAAELPLPVRACVVAAGDPSEVCAALRTAGGALREARVFLVGRPIGPARQWDVAARALDAVVARDVEELTEQLTTVEVTGVPANGHRVRRRPGAPEEAAWREWLLASPRRRRLPFRLAAADPRARRRGEADLDAAIRQPLAAGSHSIAVVSPKGGVGKTTLSFLLGSLLAEVRGSPVAAVDANPDFGTLADLVDTRVAATISDVIRDLRAPVADSLASYLTVTETGLSILAAPQDPIEMGRVGSSGYLAVAHLLARRHELVVYDCGTGFLDEITRFAIEEADQVVLVAVPQLVTAKIVVSSVAHLEASGVDLERTTLVLNMVGRDDRVDAQRLRDVLAGRIAGIVEVPHDAALSRDVDLGRFRYAQLNAPTRRALKRLAAEVVGSLARTTTGAIPSR